MVDGHSHGSSPAGENLPTGSAGADHKKRLALALTMTASYMLAEVAGGILTGSLALISDAAHMGTDVLGLGLALAAIHLASQPAAGQRTYGAYRLEVLAAVINGLLLFGVAGYVLYQAFQRILKPPEVLGVPMLVVAVIGLAVNVISFRLLSTGAKNSLNVRGAYLEVLSDMLGSVGVIVAAVVIATTGWPYADAIVGAGIGLFILPRTYQLTKQALRIIMEVAPPDIDIAEVQRRLTAITGVEAVHHLHIWTITSGMEAATAHLVVPRDKDWHSVLDTAHDILAGYGVTHPTIQVEPPDHIERASVV
ncbi:MAG: cation transporter [Mycobacterium sp.]|uniref:Cation transporter n=2 Tax=Mycobacterium asiaticum TaxID=1790 RepID=A0A1A3KYQ6_MYCAS|nr:cation diffusion facilitator family transporter [Mycobacterium asiaticum]OBJ90120.1 cation transporter [Mycobacterium asiaticum]PJE17488.1 MAG: cation transporter [Mycobacterium sp.]